MDTHTDMCIDMLIDTSVDMDIEVCIDICIDILQQPIHLDLGKSKIRPPTVSSQKSSGLGIRVRESPSEFVCTNFEDELIIFPHPQTPWVRTCVWIWA